MKSARGAIVKEEEKGGRNKEKFGREIAAVTWHARDLLRPSSFLTAVTT